jgi:hypothetical protein
LKSESMGLKTINTAPSLPVRMSAWTRRLTIGDAASSVSSLVLADPAIWFRCGELNVIVSAREFQRVVYIEPSWRSVTALAFTLAQERCEVAGCLGLFGHCSLHSIVATSFLQCRTTWPRGTPMRQGCSARELRSRWPYPWFPPLAAFVFRRLMGSIIPKTRDDI